MYLFQVLALLAFPLSALGNPLQVTLSCDGDRTGDRGAIRPAWEKENEQLIVPLTDLARKGEIDAATEEGLIATLGPRFVNALYEQEMFDGVSAKGKGSCTKPCSDAIVKAVPCLWTAFRTKSIKEVFKCVSKEQLCGCASCLPPILDTFVKTKICKASVVDVYAEEDRFSPYVDYSALADNSVSLQAFRGDLYNYQVEQLKQLNGQGTSAWGDLHTFDNGCTIGSPCGDCRCCVGACVLDHCIGVCPG